MSAFATEVKKAELFDFFEKLKSHRARPRSSIIEDAPMEGVQPTRIADPVMQKLSNIVDRSTTSTRPRRNTVASLIATQGGMDDMPIEEDNRSEDEEESSSAFPEEEDEKVFPFTFKHMVHKLYEKDEWARAVREELERSQNEFKPLAEQMRPTMAATREEEDAAQVEEGIIRFKIATSPGAGRRGSVVGSRQRSSSIAAATKQGYTPLSPAIRSPTIRSPFVRSPGAESRPEQDVRVVKKRCVGRRKSASGTLKTEGTKPSGGAWVYSSAVSASERPVATTFATFPPGPPPSPTGKVSKYQALGMKNLPSTMRAGDGGAGLKRRVSAGNEDMLAAPLMMPLQHVTNTNASGLMARRRVMAVNMTKSQSGKEQD